MKQFILILFLIPLTGFSQPFEIGHTTITFNDPARTGGYGSGGGPGRQIQSEIYYPAATAGTDVSMVPGQYPVVIFGHGFVMAWDAYQNIWEEFVPKGYIFVFPRTEGNFSPSHDDFGQDLALLVGEMEAESNDAASIFYQHHNGKTAIMGHSMGGGSSILAAANNTSIETVIGLAPAETNPSAIAAAANVTVPALVLSGDGDAVTPPADHHEPIYSALASSCKYFTNIIGGAHCYFANSNFNCDFGEGTSGGNITITRPEQHTITFQYLTPWLAYTLKGECAAKNTFDSLLVQDAAVTYINECTVSAPTITLNGSAVICESETVEIVASEPLDWSDGQNGLSIFVSDSGWFYGFGSNCTTSDSVYITVNPVDTVTQDLSICDGESVTVGTSTYTTAGNYQDVLTNQFSCDSVVLTNISVVSSFDLSITNGGHFLTANQSGSTYQWIDCQTNQAIVGETSQEFYPTQNGEFAVIIGSGSCQDTSACETVTSIGWVELSLDFELYPNPNQGAFQIQTTELGLLQIMDVNGRLVHEEPIKTKEKKIELSLENGMYWVVFTGQNDIRQVKRLFIVD
jgi:dienelactone hydrolase